MALDAYVSCRCRRDGLAAAPPSGLLVGGGNGEPELLVQGHSTAEEHEAFRDWLARACPHKWMMQAEETVTNWTGLRQFTQVLESAGWSRFPALRAGLPQDDAGSLPAALAAPVLEELDFFEREALLGDAVNLVDEETEGILMSYVEVYGGVMMSGPGWKAGVDPDGFFVLGTETDPPVTLFEALRFEQRVLDEKRVEFDDGTHRVAVRTLGLALSARGRGRSAGPHRPEPRHAPVRSVGDPSATSVGR